MARVSEPLVIFTPQACIWGAVMVLSVPVRWLGAWIIAAACHECFHCLAVLLFQKRIHRIRIGAFGAEIQTDSLSSGESVACALAGPAAGLLLLLLAKFVPRIAICAFFQSVFNLLPVASLDGSVAMKGFLKLFLKETTADKISACIENTTVCLLFFSCCAGVYFLRSGISPVIFAALFLLRRMNGKIPCKRSLYRVQ